MAAAVNKQERYHGIQQNIYSVQTPSSQDHQRWRSPCFGSRQCCHGNQRAMTSSSGVQEVDTHVSVSFTQSREMGTKPPPAHARAHTHVHERRRRWLTELPGANEGQTTTNNNIWSPNPGGDLILEPRSECSGTGSGPELLPVLTMPWLSH